MTDTMEQPVRDRVLPDLELGLEPRQDELLPAAPRPRESGGAAKMELLPGEPITPMTLLRIAVERGNTPLDVLERLMARAAETAFTEAMARFKEDPPIILKSKRVYFEAKDGGATTDYHHATHADVTMPIIKGLARVGISHSWVPEQKDGYVHVTCKLTHCAGHSDSVTMFASPDTSGNKKGVQTIVSTKTYLERHTLLAITGLTTDDMPDTDGHDTSSDANSKPAGTQSTGDAPWHDDGSAPPQDAANFYPDAKFKANVKMWRQTIARTVANGTGDADSFIAHMQSKPGMQPLTEQQKAELRAA